jgi:hypothetical protein
MTYGVQGDYIRSSQSLFFEMPKMPKVPKLPKIMESILIDA